MQATPGVGAVVCRRHPPKLVPGRGSFKPSRTYPIPLDLGNQAGLGGSSTAVGDHAGSPRDELLLLLLVLFCLLVVVHGGLRSMSERASERARWLVDRKEG